MALSSQVLVFGSALLCWLRNQIKHFDSVQTTGALIKPLSKTVTLYPTSRILQTRYMVTTCLPPLTSSRDVTRLKLRKAVARRQLLLLMSDFGLTNAPASFQRLLEHVLQNYIGKFVILYIDDILIFSSTFEDHSVMWHKSYKSSKRHTSRYELTNASLLGILLSF